jgi:hypothetical protein
MKPSSSKFERLNRLTDRYPSQAKFQMYRNLCFGAAGSSLLILLVIFQTGIESTALCVSQIGGAAALPTWFGLAGVFEYYILIGPRSYPYYRRVVAETYLPALFLLGGAGLLAAIGGILYQLQKVALYAFLVSVGTTIFVTLIHHAGLANALFSSSSPESKSPTDDT